jgi:hypothetical protein
MYVMAYGLVNKLSTATINHISELGVNEMLPFDCPERKSESKGIEKRNTKHTHTKKKKAKHS